MQNQLVDLSKILAVSVIDLYEEIKKRGRATAIASQLLRSGTSIGANIHEANYGSSRADFINKFQIAFKECYETDYWLDVFHDAKIITDDEYRKVNAQCSKIRVMLIASLKTSKSKAGSNKQF